MKIDIDEKVEKVEKMWRKWWFKVGVGALGAFVLIMVMS